MTSKPCPFCQMAQGELASDMDKPDGLTVLSGKDVPSQTRERVIGSNCPPSP